ncbi:hypothetical protein ACF0H5_000640 [Mactra antiquata]
MSRFCIAFVLASCTICVTLAQHNVEFHFSKIALQMPEYLGRREVRHNWMIVPHLYQADKLRVNFCIQERTSVRINDIVYSNDGLPDKIEILLDGTLLGQFYTHTHSDWGNLWSNQSSSGLIGQTNMLAPGNHELTFHVANSGDCFGVELWSMQVSVFTAVDPSSFWCDSGYTLAERTNECGGPRIHTEEMITPAKSVTTTTVPPSSYVTVQQFSKTTKCFDRRNVNILFSTDKLPGTEISVKQDAISTQATQFSIVRTPIDGKLCEQEIWQLGKMDENNNEFSSIYPGKYLTVNLTDDVNQEQKFPMKLLPFTTSDIIINFDMPQNVDMKEGSAYFALGLVNLTKPVNVGLRYYDHTIGDFSRTHFVTFTPKYHVFGWNIPNLGKTDNTKNIFHLHFESDTNVIMFDFLKLLYTKRDERKQKHTIARREYLKINGLRYETTVGMEINVDDTDIVKDLDDIIIMHQAGEFNRYKTVLRVSSAGIFYPYKTFYIPQQESDNAIVDVSGFHFGHSYNASYVTTPTKIRYVFIDTNNYVIKVIFEDQSVLHFRLIVTDDETMLKIISYSGVEGNGRKIEAQNLIFTSTYVDNYYAAINTIKNEIREQEVMSTVETLSGGYNFTLKKTTASNLFYSNNVININFPK